MGLAQSIELTQSVTTDNMKNFNTFIRLISFVITCCVFLVSKYAKAQDVQNLPSIHNYKVTNIDSEEVSLESFKGKVLLIINTASQCGFTPQYEDLEKLQNQYKDKPFVVLGFPSNDFGGQEPGSNKDIKDFCKTKFGVTFPLFAKGSVRGEEIQPLFKFLTTEANPDLTGSIKWNFEKFVIDQNGKLVERFGSFTNPMSNKVTKIIDSLLEKKN